MMKTLRLLFILFLALDLAIAPTAMAHPQEAKVLLREGSKIRSVQFREDGKILVREITLPPGAVIEIPVDRNQRGITRMFWHSDSTQPPIPFVGGLRLIQAPGFNARDVREFNQMSEREGLYIQKELVDRAPLVRLQSRSRVVQIDQPTAVLRDHDMTPSVAEPGQTSGRDQVNEQTAQALVERIERGNRSARETRDNPQPCTNCQQAHFDNWVRAGVPERALRNALAYYNSNQHRIRNKRYITIVDYTAHSSEKRMFILDTATGAVEKHQAAHGSGSDPSNSGYVRQFSGRTNSHATPAGIHLTGEAYRGKHGLSMRLDGMEDRNRSSRSRAVVLHGADYASESFIRKYGRAGRSWGCIVVDPSKTRSMVERLSGGSVVYNYGG
jgi:hypothetical protein